MDNHLEKSVNKIINTIESAQNREHLQVCKKMIGNFGVLYTSRNQFATGAVTSRIMEICYKRKMAELEL